MLINKTLRSLKANIKRFPVPCKFRFLFPLQTCALRNFPLPEKCALRKLWYNQCSHVFFITRENHHLSDCVKSHFAKKEVWIFCKKPRFVIQ